MKQVRGAPSSFTGSVKVQFSLGQSIIETVASSFDSRGDAAFPWKEKGAQFNFRKEMVYDPVVSKFAEKVSSLKIVGEQGRVLAQADFNLADHVNVKAPDFRLIMNVVDSGSKSAQVVLVF